MSDGKLSLNLNEENELAFKIMIEGSSSDVNATKPYVRFVLSEKGEGNNKAWLYPTSKDDEGCVTVHVTGEEFLSEEKEYTGQLEVILGNHYFVPTTVDIEFIRPLKVEAVVVSNQSTLKESETKPQAPTAVSVATVQVRNQKKKVVENNQPQPQPAPKSNKKTKRQWDDLTKEEQERVKNVLRERKLSELRKAKLEETKKKKTQALRRKKAQKQAEQSIKSQLKNLMADSLAD
jgi:hypothetical protein